MKNKTVSLGRFVCAVPFVWSVAVSSPAALAYDDQTTHPALTDEIVSFYNLSFPDSPIAAEEREWIVEGSISEDAWPRWINHFYDPVRQSGWSGRHAGRVEPDVAMAFSRAVLSVKEPPVPAVEWLTADLRQEAYRRYGGNRSWQRGIEYYASGNREEAYRTLGHALHLLEDLAVPDHVRDDTHAHPLRGITGDPGSPYEAYAARFTRETIAPLDIAEALAKEGKRPPVRSRPAEYLTAAAEYANEYFFSKDTIGDPQYLLPRPARQDSRFAYGVDERGKEYPLAAVVRGWSSDDSSKEYLRLSEEDTDVLAAYFSRLSRKAVLEGAGMIALFKEQAADAEVNKNFPPRLVRFDARKLVVPTFSLAAEAKKAALAVGDFFAGLFSDRKNEVADDIETRRVSKEAFSAAVPDEPLPRRVASAETAQPPLVERVGAAADRDAIRTRLEQILREAQIVQSRIAARSSVSTSTESSASNKKNAASVPPKTTPKVPGSSGGGSPASVSVGGGGGGLSGGGGSSGGSSASQPPSPGQTESAAASSSPALLTSGRVLISEVQVAGPGGAGDEFIELHNAEDTAIDLSGWSVQYVSGASSLESLKKRNFGASSMISAHDYFLIARGLNADGGDGYAGAPPADLTQRSFSLSGAAAGGTVFLVKNGELVTGPEDPDIADRVAYGSGDGLFSEGGAPAPLPAAAESVERKALTDAGACVAAVGDGEFLGNACDTNVNADDFAVRSSPTPQGAGNLPEPRQPPQAAGFRAEYVSSSVSAFFVWEKAEDAEGASNIRYAVRDVSEGAADSPVCETNGTLACDARISVVGRRYALTLTAYDRDGLGGSSAPVEIDVSGFLRDAFFYRDPRSPSHAPAYFADFIYDRAPFVPSVFGKPDAWQGMMFYLDRPANPANLTLSTLSFLEPADSEGVVPFDRGGIRTAAAIFALRPELAPGFGEGLRSVSLSAVPGEDDRMRIRLLPPPGPDLTESDYLTIGYYDFSDSGAGRQELTLVATDARRFGFRETLPPFLPPRPPSDIAVLFDELHSQIAVSWASSTDPDSPDSEITYEVNVTTLPACPEDGWIGNGKQRSLSAAVAFGNEYTIGVRAVDEFGNTSAPAVITWRFPEGYAPLPAQEDHSVQLGWTRGMAQSITLAGGADVRSVAMWMGNGGGVYCCAESFLEVRRNVGGLMGEIVGTSAPVKIAQWVNEQENVYAFDPPLPLRAGESYWLLPRPTPTNTNESSVFGSPGDPYAGGSWSGTDRDAYFRLLAL